MIPINNKNKLTDEVGLRFTYYKKEKGELCHGKGTDFIATACGCTLRAVR